MNDTVLSSRRLISLDALRGFTVAGMIVVNSPGSWQHVYPALLHSEWHGMTPTDLVFPFFVFIMGVSVVLGLAKAREVAAPAELTGKILRRSLILFVLGLLLALVGMLARGNVGLEFFRIPGVLQRLALIYACCGLLYVYTSWKTQCGVMAILLLGYWLLLEWVPVPAFGPGVLEPGKNLANWLDGQIIPGRLYQGDWDPEGLLSTLPAIASGLLGMMAGHVLQAPAAINRQLAWLLSGGIVALLLGAVWHGVFPINKNLWTSSYVLFTGGLAAVGLALSVWLVDLRGYRRWTWIGIVLGANAITAYVLHGLFKWPFILIHIGDGESAPSIRQWCFELFRSTGISGEAASLVWALMYTALCFLPVWWLYRHRIFIKV